MIPLKTLYDVYIYRSKLTAQENQFKYIVPPAFKRGWNNNKRGYYRRQFIQWFESGSYIDEVSRHPEILIFLIVHMCFIFFVIAIYMTTYSEVLAQLKTDSSEFQNL